MFIYHCQGLKKQTGVMIVELMVASALALALISFLYEIYISGHQNYRWQIALHQIQDNARTAIDILKADIHQAGHVGCAKLSHDFIVPAYLNYSITAQNRLVGSGSELVVRYAKFTGVVLKESMKDAMSLRASRETRFAVGDILIISNCKQAEIFQIKEIIFSHDYQIITPVQPLLNQYDQYDEINRLMINKYFIAKTKRKNQDGSSIYALFVQDINQHATELVENIAEMQITYSLLQDGKVTDVSANAIGDWSALMGVSIDLTVVSPPIKRIWHMHGSLTLG